MMRILAAGEPIPLDKLGLSPRNLRAPARRRSSKPYGLFFVCGPTGSGKTTTLHSVLGYLNTPDTKIWTAEDPVEITQKGLRQVQVNRKAGLDFRDRRCRRSCAPTRTSSWSARCATRKPSSIGIEASLTGHLVFATLHTNSAPESIMRLLDMGMDPFNFADALLGILAQRLAKRLCKCKEAARRDATRRSSCSSSEYCAGAAAHRRRGRAIPKASVQKLLRATGSRSSATTRASSRCTRAEGLRHLRRHRLQGPRRPARAADRHRHASRS